MEHLYWQNNQGSLSDEVSPRDSGVAGRPSLDTLSVTRAVPPHPLEGLIWLPESQ